jgi:hypothetical protein
VCTSPRHQIQQDDPARAIIGFARQHEVTQILIGPIHSSWPHIAVGGRVLTGGPLSLLVLACIA